MRNLFFGSSVLALTLAACSSQPSADLGVAEDAVATAHACRGDEIGKCNCPRDMYCCPTDGGCFKEFSQIQYTVCKDARANACAMPGVTPVIAPIPTSDASAGSPREVLASLCDRTSPDRAKVAADVLQRGWGGQEYWSSWSRWRQSNMVESLVNYVQYTGDRRPLATVTATFANSDVNGLAGSNSYDDVQWETLAWLRANELTPDPAYVARAARFYQIAASAWDDASCGGGVWWSGARDYKNAITSELFIMTSMMMFEQSGDARYLENAKKTWAWFKTSGMINRDGLINDGLNRDTCKNNGQTTWTYNQGVILGGLAKLSRATGDASLLDAGTAIVDAVLRSRLVDERGVLKESCENGDGVCNGDQRLFKGIFLRHLAYFLETAGRADLVAKYKPFVAANADGIWNRDNDNGNFGVRWTGPVEASDESSQAAALDGLNAAVRFQSRDVCPGP